MIYVHGGGGRKGDKSAVGQKPGVFSDLGWVLVSTNYRLIPDGRHPNNVDDIAAAISWVHKNIADHGGDPDRIFLMGHSAGAHLVSLVATDQRQLKRHGHTLDVIKGVISLDTNAYDVARQVAGSSGLYRQVFGSDPEQHRSASPLMQVSSGKSIPPFLVCFSSGLTARVNPNRSQAANEFADKLKQAGISATVIDASDRNHGQINQRFGAADDGKVTGASKEFLLKLLRFMDQKANKSTVPIG